MTKKEFKQGYSKFRNDLSRAATFGKRELHSSIWNENPFFRKMVLKIDYPVSIKIWSFKHKKGLLN